MTDVKKSEIYPVFYYEICFMAIYGIFCVICFVAIYVLLRGKSWAKNCIGGEKWGIVSFSDTVLSLCFYNGIPKCSLQNPRDFEKRRKI